MMKKKCKIIIIVIIKKILTEIRANPAQVHTRSPVKNVMKYRNAKAFIPELKYLK